MICYPNGIAQPGFGDPLTIEITANKHLRSDEFFIVDGDLLCHRAEDLFQALRGVLWHEVTDHCPTWSAGCRCDVEQA